MYIVNPIPTINYRDPVVHHELTVGGVVFAPCWTSGLRLGLRIGTGSVGKIKESWKTAEGSRHRTAKCDSGSFANSCSQELRS